MPKLVPTIGITVIRDGKRVTPKPGKAFDFTADEVKSVTAQHATAFRKPVNESDEDIGTDETAPEQDASATANKTPKRPAAEKAAQKSSTSQKATNTKKESGEPKDTKPAADDADEDGDDDDTDTDTDAGEDDDI